MSGVVDDEVADNPNFRGTAALLTAMATVMIARVLAWKNIRGQQDQ
jgi:hypothetical protein